MYDLTKGSDILDKQGRESQVSDIKEVQGKKFKRIHWGLLTPAIIITLAVFIIPPLEIFPVEITLILVLLFIVLMVVIVMIAFSNKKIHRKLEKLSKQLNTRCWILVADTPFPQEYLFDLENGYMYGAFALNPFCVQRIDLREVEDVEIVYTAHRIAPFTQWKISLNAKSDVENVLGEKNNAILSGIVCRIHFAYGTESICQWHDRKRRHLSVGRQSELARRENALKLKKLILDLKKIAQVKRVSQNLW